MDISADLHKRIIELPAKTLAGLRAKAGFVREALGYVPDRLDDHAPDWALLHDVLGEPPEWRPVRPDRDSSPPSPTVNPDAELLDTCARFDAFERRCIDLYEGPGRILDDDERDVALEPIKAAQEPLLDRICTLRAMTVAGHRARARTLALWDGDIQRKAEQQRCVNDRLLAALLRDFAGDAE